MSFDSLLTQTLTLRRPTVKTSEIGSPKRRWSTVSGASALPCRVEQLSSMERLIAGREGLQATHRCFVGPSIPILAKDRVIVSDVTYDIEGVNESRGRNTVHHYEALLQLLT